MAEGEEVLLENIVTNILRQKLRTIREEPKMKWTKKRKDKKKIDGYWSSYASRMKSGRVNPKSLKFVHSYMSASTPRILEYWRETKRPRLIIHLSVKGDSSLCKRQGPASKLNSEFKHVTCRRCLSIIEKNPNKLKRLLDAKI